MTASMTPRQLTFVKWSFMLLYACAAVVLLTPVLSFGSILASALILVGAVLLHLTWAKNTRRSEPPANGPDAPGH